MGFRNFYYHKLLRKRSVKRMLFKIKKYKSGKVPQEKILESFQGWNAYASWANTLRLRMRIVREIYNR